MKEAKPRSRPKDIKKYPGCMGGIMHLFDFNQHTGKKYLTDKSRAEKLLKATSAVEDDHDNPSSKEAKLVSSSKKKNVGGLPMKTLIAEEMTKEMESKRRAPSVVARLMGLETFPSESSMLAKYIQSSDKEPKQKSETKSGYEPGKSSPKSAAPPASKEIAFPKSKRKGSKHKNKDAFDFPVEQPTKQKRDYKKKQLEGADSNYGSKKEQFDEFNMQLIEKRMLVQETLNEAKLNIARQRFNDARHQPSDSRSLQSKEFLDALGVLKTNKELFLKFIEEPNSSFAKHLQDLKNASQASLEFRRTPKMKSGSAADRSKILQKEETSAAKNSSAGRVQRQGQKISTDEEWKSRSSFAGSKGQPVREDSIKSESSFPTRIVVLKPAPGNSQNDGLASRGSSFKSLGSQKSFNEGMKASSQDFLEEIRERLKIGLTESEKDDFVVTQPSIKSRPNVSPKDPKEIAREIARQVRESVTRDLTKGYSKSKPESRNKRHSFDISRHSTGESFIYDFDGDINSENKVPPDHRQKVVAPPYHLSDNASVSSESTVNKEAKKRLSERVKLTHAKEENPSTGIPSTLGKMLALQDGSASKSSSKKVDHKTNVSFPSAESDLLSIELDHEQKAGFGIHRKDTSNARKPGKGALRDKQGPAFFTDFAEEWKEEDANIDKGTKGDLVKSKKDHLVLEDSSLSHNLQGESRAKCKINNSFTEPDMFGDSSQMPLDHGHCDSDEAPFALQEPIEREKDGSLLEDLLSQEVIDDSDTKTKAESIDQISNASEEIIDESMSHHECYEAEENFHEQSSPTSATCCSPSKQVRYVGHKLLQASKDRIEYSSPISVLDSPFQEETPSPQFFKEINSNLRDLRLHLRSLKFDGSEGSKNESMETDATSEKSCDASSVAASPAAFKAPSSAIPHLNLESLSLDDIVCHEGRISALLYLRLVLVASGLSGDAPFTSWHSLNQPVDPSLFEKIEIVLEKDSIDLSESEIMASKLDRVLLFDCINEVLLRMLGPFLNQRPWVSDPKSSIRYMPTGKWLLKETWAVIDYHLDTEWESNNILENLIARDLDREIDWLDLRNDIESVGYELERELFDDLIEEIAIGLML